MNLYHRFLVPPPIGRSDGPPFDGMAAEVVAEPADGPGPYPCLLLDTDPPRWLRVRRVRLFRPADPSLSLEWLAPDERRRRYLDAARELKAAGKRVTIRAVAGKLFLTYGSARNELSELGLSIADLRNSPERGDKR